MSDTNRALVRERAGNRCEYCRIHQAAEPFLTFHVEHIISRQHAGTSDADNLALACSHCNLHKGPNLSSIDPDTGTLTVLFHPRNQIWQEHFSQSSGLIRGTTPTARATVWLLRMNDPDRVKKRLRFADL